MNGSGLFDPEFFEDVEQGAPFHHHREGEGGRRHQARVAGCLGRLGIGVQRIVTANGLGKKLQPVIYSYYVSVMNICNIF